MTTTRNAEKLRQDKRMFYLIVEQIVAVTSSTNLGKEVKNLSPNLKGFA